LGFKRRSLLILPRSNGRPTGFTTLHYGTLNLEIQLAKRAGTGRAQVRAGAANKLGR